jgi:energy-coupling factor transport system ATP-binding protein
MPIEVRHLTHTYSAGSAFQATAVHDVSLTIEDGEFVCIVGHTGSGKSTLVQHLNGLLKPTSGQILVDGEDLNDEHADRRRIRQKVGLVFQYPEYQLFEETIAKDIAFGPKNQGLSEDEIDQRVRRAMAHVHLDYDKYADRSPFDLSGGQMRRVAIAGVLAMEPRVLILDEPAAGLDPRGRDRILGMLSELHREGGVTIVMVSHSMDDCARLATRMIVMSKGELVMTDTPRNVFRQADTMRSIGLNVPEAAQLCAKLRQAGLSLPEDLYTQEELHDHLLRLWREKQAKEADKP